MAVTKRTRYEVLKRDNHTCRYCGIAAPEVVLTVDHVVPVALGGSDAPDNLVAACRDCNAGKSSTSPDAPLVEDVKQDALRWAAAMKLASARVASRGEPLRQYVEYTQDAVMSMLDKNDLPSDWRESLPQFFNAGLPREMFEEAIAIAASRSNIAWSAKWRYAMGVAWTMVREIQSEARAIVDEEG